MLRSRHKLADHAAALERVEAWTRLRFKLADDAVVLVSEIACGLPGCPPLETVVAFWTQGDARHQFKVFKPVVDVLMDDLPPTYTRDEGLAQALGMLRPVVSEAARQLGVPAEVLWGLSERPDLVAMIERELGRAQP